MEKTSGIEQRDNHSIQTDQQKLLKIEYPLCSFKKKKNHSLNERMEEFEKALKIQKFWACFFSCKGKLKRNLKLFRNILDIPYHKLVKMLNNRVNTQQGVMAALN